MLLQGGDELRSARQRVLLVHQNAIHVSEPGFDRLGIGHGSHSSPCSVRQLPDQIPGLSLSKPEKLPFDRLRAQSGSRAPSACQTSGMTDARLPDPVVVVLAGAAGSGKSTWAAERFRTAEVVSSDALRATVGSGPADLEATADAFALLDQIVAARAKRSLTTVIDTLGLDPERRDRKSDG